MSIIILTRQILLSFLKHPINLFSRISGPIMHISRRRTALIRLIPKADDPGASVRIPKSRILQRDSRIQKSKKNPPPPKLQRRLLLATRSL